MQESTPGPHSNTTASETKNDVSGAEKIPTTSEDERKESNLDYSSNTQSNVENPDFHTPTNHRSDLELDHDEVRGQRGLENSSVDENESANYSDQGDDHSSDEDYEPDYREVPLAPTDQVPGEPGPLYAIEPPHTNSPQFQNIQLPEHFRRYSSDTAGQLPLPPWANPNWQGLHSPDLNSFSFPLQFPQQTAHVPSRSDSSSQDTPQPLHPHLRPPYQPPLSSPLHQPFHSIPGSSSRPPHQRRQSGPILTDLSFDDLPGAGANTPRFVGRRRTSSNTNTPYSRALPQPSSRRRHMRSHSRQRSMHIDMLDELIFPSSRPGSRHHRNYSQASSVYDSDSDSQSVGDHQESIGSNHRRHRPSSSRVSMGVSSGLPKSLVELHDRANAHQFPSIHSIMVFDKDDPGQYRPLNFADEKGRMTTDFWKEQSTVCLIITIRDDNPRRRDSDRNLHLVTRRLDNNLINGTKLLNAAGVTRGRRDGILKAEKERHVVRTGGMGYKGVWIPFERALELAKQLGVLDTLYPIFLADLRQIFRIPENYARLMQVIRGGVKITAQLRWWLESMNKPQTFSPGYHFYDQDANPLAVEEFVGLNPQDENFMPMTEEEVHGQNENEEEGEEEEERVEPHFDAISPHLLRNPEDTHAREDPDLDYSIEIPPILVPETTSQPIPGASNAGPSTGELATASSSSGVHRGDFSLRGSRQVNPSEFMQPPIAQYTEYLRHAYQSYEPRPRDQRFFISEGDETDTEYE